MTKLFWAVLSIVFLSQFSYCQEGIWLDYNKFVLSVNQFSKSAVYIEAPSTGKAGTGTLFVVPHSDLSTLGDVFVASARHLVQDSVGAIMRPDTVMVTMQVKNGKQERRRYALILVGARDIDVAIFTPLETFRPFKDYEAFAPTTDEIASFAEIMTGQTVFIAGYPLGLGVKGTLNPIVQSGIISQVDTAKNLVLIDIPVNFGNSGCPAYVVNNDGVAKLLGLVFLFEPNTEFWGYRPSTGQPSPANSSLGRVVLLSGNIDEVKQFVRTMFPRK